MTNALTAALSPQSIGTVLNLLQKYVVPNIGTTGTVASVIQVVSDLVPAVTEEYQALLPVVKGIIASLSASDATLPEQLSALRALDKQIDDAYNAAKARAQAEDAAAGDNGAEG